MFKMELNLVTDPSISPNYFKPVRNSQISPSPPSLSFSFALQDFTDLMISSCLWLLSAVNRHMTFIVVVTYSRITTIFKIEL